MLFSGPFRPADRQLDHLRRKPQSLHFGYRLPCRFQGYGGNTDAERCVPCRRSPQNGPQRYPASADEYLVRARQTVQ